MATYITWSLLPLCLFLLAGWAVCKKIFKMHGKEDGKEYAKQGFYCSVILAVAIPLEQSLSAGLFLTLLGPTEAKIVSWLVYPALLLVAAWMQGWYEAREEKKREAARPKNTRHAHF